jgi:uncharacterized membrane protein
MNSVIGNLLRFGVLISAAVIIVGIIRLSATGAFDPTSPTLAYHPDVIPHGNYDVSLAGLINGLSTLDPFSLIELGVILLIATPVSRVLVSVFLFAAEGDKVYVLVTAIVLTLLLFSMLITPIIPGFRA